MIHFSLKSYQVIILPSLSCLGIQQNNKTTKQSIDIFTGMHLS